MLEAAAKQSRVSDEAQHFAANPDKNLEARESCKLSEPESERLEEALEEAVRVVSSLLSDVVELNIHHVSTFPLHDQIPEEHLSGCYVYPEADSSRRTVIKSEGAGLPDTDFLLYIHVQATDKCRAEPGVLAYAVHCQTDAGGRPVAGVVVLCRDRLSGASCSHQATVQTLIHEMFHTLGFSKDLFSSWQDCSPDQGASCSPRNKVIHSDGSGQTRIYTPAIVSALQRHLMSSDPELGGPLENLVLRRSKDESAGKVSSHWESRVLQGSIMAAALGNPTTVRIDPVTLAALQDTGWYSVNLSRAQSLVWGDGEGAKFGSVSICKDDSSTFFCSGSGVGCHFLHLHKGKCQTDPYLEGCRVYKPLETGSECWKKENARWSAENWSGEMFGSDSRCFFSSLTRQGGDVWTSSSVEGRCYRHRCSGPNRYQIQVSGSEWVDCPAGGAIQVKGHRGEVFCPDRRLCLYPDVSPPIDRNSSSGFTTWSTAPAIWLCFGAAVCVLVALLVSYWKCRTCVFRSGSVAPEDHSQL
ncbi:ciliated left-right organizer metallopeptidase [Poeciliopsis prolifica]|uniref:ciliated left-right organizer metallopeptidase n=1 Tax=Poeciliopsis prolifica TaxID=188132 RepID=UPI00241444D2|nr:ciliated left-right organizer metallopeptidase [Poeciliopsis prolifica]